MKKEEKQKQAESLHEELKRAKIVILSGFEGIKVAQDSDLRAKVAQTGGHYKVYKNSTIERAAQGTAAAPVAGKLRGTTSVAYTQAEPVALAKALTAYAKENPIFIFKAGVVEGRVVSVADLTAIASLPSRESLFSKVLFLINSPAQRAASAVSAVARNLACVIKEGVDEKKFKES